MCSTRRSGDELQVESHENSHVHCSAVVIVAGHTGDMVPLEEGKVWFHVMRDGVLMGLRSEEGVLRRGCSGGQSAPAGEGGHAVAPGGCAFKHEQAEA